MRITFISLIIILLFWSCQNKSGKKETVENTQQVNSEAQNTNEGWDSIRSSIIKFDSFDGNRILESGQGFFISENQIVTNYSLVKNATHIEITPLGESESFNVNKFVAIDRINDLIILQCDSIKRKSLELYLDSVPRSAKSLYIVAEPGQVVQLFSGKVLELATIRGNQLFRITNRIRKSFHGMPVFLSNQQVLGIAFSAIENYEVQSFATPAKSISELMTKRSRTPLKLASLNQADEQISAQNRNIKGLLLETEAGDITIRLFNETPEYRDNFIKLSKEGFFDGLLIHRVIADFGIQSGAADSRNAKKGDSVGFKGPGYTLPAHFNTVYYHKRGMIGSPRKPDTKNERLRSDGSQFYIVSGRKYSDGDLNEIEKQNKYKFSPEQRETYKTIGGAPHLDGSYTIFGEVVSGMEIVDQIVKVETDRQWRPLKDIRLKRIRILK